MSTANSGSPKISKISRLLFSIYKFIFSHFDHSNFKFTLVIYKNTFYVGMFVNIFVMSPT